MFDINATSADTFINAALTNHLKWWTMKIPTHLMTLQKFFTDMSIILSPVVKGHVQCTAEEKAKAQELFDMATSGMAWTQQWLQDVPRFYESAEEKGAFAGSRRGLKNEVMTMPVPKVDRSGKELTPIEKIAAQAEQLQADLEKKLAEPFVDAEGKPVDQTKPLAENEKQLRAAGGRKKSAEGKELTPSEKEAVAAEKKARKGIVSKGEAE